MGNYKPGQALSIRTLAELFGTSTMPVREALRRLASEQALEVTPSRAFRVIDLSPGRAAGLFDIRKQLESYATRLAVPLMDRPTIDRLDKLEQAILAAINEENSTNYLVANYRFHFLIYTAARNPDLRSLIDGLWLRIGPFLGGILDHGFTEEFRLFHGDAVKAMKALDVEGACRAIEDDIQWATNYFLRLDEKEWRGAFT